MVRIVWHCTVLLLNYILTYLTLSLNLFNKYKLIVDRFFSPRTWSQMKSTKSCSSIAMNVTGGVDGSIKLKYDHGRTRNI